MKYLKLFENWLTEAKEDVVIFSIDDGDLDDKFLANKSYSRKLDYHKVGRDTYYTLPKREFDMFYDWADSSGYDVEDVIIEIDEGKLNEFIPGTLMDMGKHPGDIWQLIISKSWAAISPGGWRMSYKANKHGKKNAEMWAKTGKDRLGNDEIGLADTYGDEHELALESETYRDYPEAAKKNAKKAIDWKEKYGRDEVTAATRVGWARANQLAGGEAISADTVKRMSSFNRHRKNSKIDAKKKDTPWKDNGYVAWLTWGGDEGVDWAMRKSEQIDKNEKS